MKHPIVCMTCIALIACSSTISASNPSTQSRNPSDTARAIYEAQPEYQAGKVVLDELETISNWQSTPEGFAVVRSFSRRLGHTDRGISNILILHDSGKVIATLDPGMPPNVRHIDGQLRINNLPPISLKTPRDAYALSTVNYGNLLQVQDCTDYAELIAERVFGLYKASGKANLENTPMSDLLGRLASLRDPSCERKQSVQLAEGLPAQIKEFRIEEPTFEDTHAPRLITSKTWETQLHTTLIDTEEQEHNITLLVVGDPCDRDKISEIHIY